MGTRPEEPYQNSSLTFTCPLDGLALKTTQPTLVGDKRKTKLAHHVHIEFDERAVCANGHNWHLSGGLILERVRA